MADSPPDDEVTNEQRLEAENQQLRSSAIIKDSIIQEYRQALADEQFKVAHQPTE